jgi:hypothetical protein
MAAMLEASIAKLSEALLVAQTSLPPQDYDLVKREVGILIARISHNLLDPIYEEFPDLAPPGVL